MPAGGIANVKNTFGVHYNSSPEAEAGIRQYEIDLGVASPGGVHWAQANGPGTYATFDNVGNIWGPGKIDNRLSVISIGAPGYSLIDGWASWPPSTPAGITTLVSVMNSAHCNNFIVNMFNEWDMLQGMRTRGLSGQLASDMAILRAAIAAEQQSQLGAVSFHMGSAAIGRQWSYCSDAELAQIALSFVVTGGADRLGSTLYDAGPYSKVSDTGTWVDPPSAYSASTGRSMSFWRTLLSTGSFVGRNVQFFCPEYGEWNGPGWNWNHTVYSTQVGGSDNVYFIDSSIADLALFPASGDGALAEWDQFTENADVPHDIRVNPVSWASFKGWLTGTTEPGGGGGGGTPPVDATSGIVRAAVNSAVSGTSLTATFPSAGVATAGRLLVAFCHGGGYQNYPSMSGWTAVDPAHDSVWTEAANSIFIKKAVGGETGGSMTVVSSNRMELHVFEVGSVTNVDAIIATPSLLLRAWTQTSSTVTSLATANIDHSAITSVLHFAFADIGFAGISAPAATNGFAVTTEGAGTLCFCASKTAVNPGSTGTTMSWVGGGRTETAIIAMPLTDNSLVVGSQVTEDDFANPGSSVISNVSVTGSQASTTNTGNTGTAIVAGQAIVVTGSQATSTETANHGSYTVTLPTPPGDLIISKRRTLRIPRESRTYNIQRGV
jgi:hypothetical protein